MISKRNYWEDIGDEYQRQTKISCDDFHYGPLICGDADLQLLPAELENKRCLEIACGGAQNSIFLAGCGADCTALDASGVQLVCAEKLIRAHGVKIELKQFSMETLPGDFKPFDLIHSAYGFNFAVDFEMLVKAVSSLLDPGGILLFSMPHPLFCGEFLELDDEPGLFISEYLNPPPDIRFDEQGNETACSRSYSTNRISRVLAQNGFLLERVCEPGVCENPPYTSKIWEEYRAQFSKFPGTIIFKAVKSG